MEVDIVELHSEDPESLKERIIRLQDQIEKQNQEIIRLRNILLIHDDPVESITNQDIKPISVPVPNSDEEISVVWTADESEADGLAASINSLLRHTLPVSE